MGAMPPYSLDGLPGVTGSAGAFHGAEQEFVWHMVMPGSTDWPNLMGDDEKLLARTMAAYWVNFAVSSDPNGVAGGVRPELTRLQWPDYTSCQTCSQGQVVFLNEGSLKVADMPFGKQCDVMEKHRLLWGCERPSNSKAAQRVCTAAGPNGDG